MGRIRLGRAALALALMSACVACPAPEASAAPVVVLGPGVHSQVEDDPFLPAEQAPGLLAAPLSPDPALAPQTVTRAAAAQARAARATAGRGRSPRRTVQGELARLRRTHGISAGQYRSYLSTLRSSTSTQRRLRGVRADELGAVLDNLRDMAAAGALTPSRLPALFLTLSRNSSWWSRGPRLSSGQRVEFAGSDLVWEYYPGQGIELQELGSFGKANGLFTAGPSHYARMLRMLDELIPLASRRAGGIAWEYFFRFENGIPPWTSAMSQATALQTLTRAYIVTGNARYLTLGREVLPVLVAPPPGGVSVATARGRRFLLYSFAPGERVINAFLQTLIGLYDFKAVSGDRRAGRLFAQGNAEAQAEVPSYDTGSWSLYEPGQLDTVDYHELVTGFLHGLCDRTRAAVYCRTATRFDAYLKHPPPGV